MLCTQFKNCYQLSNSQSNIKQLPNKNKNGKENTWTLEKWSMKQHDGNMPQNFIFI